MSTAIGAAVVVVAAAAAAVAACCVTSRMAPPPSSHPRVSNLLEFVDLRVELLKQGPLFLVQVPDLSAFCFWPDSFLCLLGHCLRVLERPCVFDTLYTHSSSPPESPRRRASGGLDPKTKQEVEHNPNERRSREHHPLDLLHTTSKSFPPVEICAEMA